MNKKEAKVIQQPVWSFLLNVKPDQQRKVIVVTGSSGFIGSVVVQKLAEQFVVAFDRETSLYPPVVF